jgi:hypothetical protein
MWKLPSMTQSRAMIGADIEYTEILKKSYYKLAAARQGVLDKVPTDALAPCRA